jgi:hypothetical protein
VSIATLTSGEIARFSSPSYDSVYVAAGNVATSCGIGTISSSAFNLFVNSTSRLIVTNAGDVGIGTSSPESRLAVKGGSGAADLFSISDITVPTSGSEFGVSMIKTASTDYMLNMTSYGATGKGARVYHTGGVAADYAFYVASGAGDRLIVDGRGNVGVGIAPETTWNSIYKVLQLDVASIFGSSSYDNISIGSNIFVNGANSTRYYRTGTYAAQYTQYQGGHFWYTTTVAGTAGDAVSFNNSMVLTNAGNVGIGTINPGAPLQVTRNSLAVLAAFGSAGTNATGPINALANTLTIGRSVITVPASTTTSLVGGYGGNMVLISLFNVAGGADIQYTIVVTSGWNSATVLFSNTYGGNSATFTFSASGGTLQVSHNHSSAIYMTVQPLVGPGPSNP